MLELKIDFVRGEKMMYEFYFNLAAMIRLFIHYFHMLIPVDIFGCTNIPVILLL